MLHYNDDNILVYSQSFYRVLLDIRYVMRYDANNYRIKIEMNVGQDNEWNEETSLSP